MKLRLLALALACLLLLPLSLPASADTVGTTAENAARSYYYDQLEEPAREIYDALVPEENLNALRQGDAVTVKGPYVMQLSSDLQQEKYNAIVAEFQAELERLSAYYAYISRVMVALDRDHPELFWLDGIRAAIVICKDGEPLQGGSVIFSVGATYTATLEVTCPVAGDWAQGGTRALSEDIATLQANVLSLAEEARAASSGQYGQLVYLNERLCYYNDYNDDALAAGGSAQYGASYPWTPLSALDQLSSPDDAASGALRPVCEGYARALKLVCDVLGIPCVLVSGTADGEDHMWCYVSPGDGAWYAMDVTWNDTSGAFSYLLAGADVMNVLHQPHDRVLSGGASAGFSYPVLAPTSYDPKILTLVADCTELLGGGTVTLTPGGPLDFGEVTVTSFGPCELVGQQDGSWVAVLPNRTEIYLFTATMTGEGEYDGLVATCSVTVMAHTHAFGEWQVEQTASEDHPGARFRACACGEEEWEEIPQLTHEYTATVVLPTCDDDGYTEHVCKNCTHSYTDQTVPAQGHLFSNGVCERCGATESGGTALGLGNVVSALVEGGCDSVVTGAAVPLLLTVPVALIVLSNRKKRSR